MADGLWIEGDPTEGALLVGALLRGWPLAAFPHVLSRLQETAWGSIALRVAGANGKGGERLANAFRGLVAPGWTEERTRLAFLEQLAKQDDFVQAWIDNDPEVRRRAAAPASDFAGVADMFEVTSWVWRDWIPQGYLSMLVGRPGVGKTMVLLWIADRILRGGEMPDGSVIEPAHGDIMWIDTEGTQALVVERLNRLGADKSRFFWPRDPAKPGDLFPAIDLSKPRWADIVFDMAIHRRPAAIIVDSLRGSFRGSEKESGELQDVLIRAAALARDVRCVHLLSHHLRKPPPGERLEVDLDSVRGSTVIPAMARVLMAVDQPDPSSERRRLRVLKSNLSAFPKPLGLSIGDSIDWTTAPEAPHRETVVERAREFLLARLADGPVPSTELMQEAQAQGISRSSLFKAKDAGFVVAVRTGGATGRWVWSLKSPREEP